MLSEAVCTNGFDAVTSYFCGNSKKPNIFRPKITPSSCQKYFILLHLKKFTEILFFKYKLAYDMTHVELRQSLGKEMNRRRGETCPKCCKIVQNSGTRK